MSSIVQCPKGCGRLVIRAFSMGVPTYLNAGGAWKDYPHMCGFDGANERGDNDDALSRDEEILNR